MAKILEKKNIDEETGVEFAPRQFFYFCKGCNSHHYFKLKKESKDGKGHDFDFNFDNPTVAPSLLVDWMHPRCHSFIKLGQIEYLPDCEHELAGKIIELPDLELIEIELPENYLPDYSFCNEILKCLRDGKHSDMDKTLLAEPDEMVLPILRFLHKEGYIILDHYYKRGCIITKKGSFYIDNGDNVGCKLTEIYPEYYDEIPYEKREGVLYISKKYGIAIHLCACGCGEETVTPIKDIANVPGWKLVESNGMVSLTPSIGNFIYEHPYHAHYYITNNKIVWC